MFSRVRIAIRFFFVGLAVGILLAPRSGRETRRLVRERADRLLNDVLDAATLGTYDSGAGATDDLDEMDRGGGEGNGSGTAAEDRDRAPGRGRGGARSRNRTTTTTEPAQA